MAEPGRQISFRIPVDLYKKVAQAADQEELAVADFCRKIFKSAYQNYEAAGSLHVLRSREAEAIESRPHVNAKKKAG